MNDVNLDAFVIRFANASVQEIKDALQHYNPSDWRIPYLKALLQQKEEEVRNKPTRMYHKSKAPTGKIFKLYEVPALEKKGWVDSPTSYPETIIEKTKKNIIDPFRLLKFFLLHEEEYKAKAKYRTKTFLYFLGGLFAFDFIKLFPNETISIESQLLIRRIGLALILSVWLLSLLLLNLSFYRKYKNIPGLSSEKLNKIQKYF